MGFTEDIAKLSEQIRKRVDQVTGEEATKQSLILPFFSTLGYDIWEPTEVIPEYISDAAKKKTGQFEKVDYAISINGTIVMLVEAKACGKKPESHDGQLSRYFTWTLSAKVGVITNGVAYRFFTDLRRENIMDEEPFFSFNILEYEPKDVENLKLFHRDNFEISAISHQAEEMVYVKGMTELIGNLWRSPSEEFIRFLVAELGKLSPSYAIEGRISSKVVRKFTSIVKKSIQSSLLELMTRSLNQEIAQSIEISKDSQPDEIDEAIEEDEQQTSEASKIETTAEELEAFEKVKVIAATSTTYKLAVNSKDTVSYFGVNLGKTTWWFLRFYLTPKKKSFITRLSVNEVKSLASGFEVQETSALIGDAASRVVISSVSDLDKLAPLILKCYETEAAKH